MVNSAAAVIGKIVLGVFVFIDIILFLIPTLMNASRKKKLAEYTIPAEATVTELNTYTPNRLSSHYTNVTPMLYPTFQYMVNGQVYTHRSNVGTTSRYYKVGDRLKILVDPGDYSKYVLADNPGHRLATGILYAIAVFFLIAIVIVGIAL